MSKQTRIQARITTKEAQLETLETNYALASTELAGYKIDTGGNMQQVMYRKLDAMGREMRILESEINNLYSQLEGGNVKMIRKRRIY